MKLNSVGKRRQRMIISADKMSKYPFKIIPGQATDIYIFGYVMRVIPVTKIIVVGRQVGGKNKQDKKNNGNEVLIFDRGFHQSLMQ